MRSKLPWFLLAVSLAFNVFFVAGFFYPHFMGHRHGPGDRWDPMHSAVREFSLDSGQAEALRAMRDRFAERRHAQRGAREDFQAVIVEALSQPTFDREALAAALEQRRALAGDMILDMTQELHGFVAGLSPEQREAFLERCHQRGFLRHLLFSRSSRPE